MKVEKRRLTLAIGNSAILSELTSVKVSEIKPHFLISNGTLLENIQDELRELLDATSLALRRLERDEFEYIISASQLMNSVIHKRLERLNWLMKAAENRERDIERREKDVTAAFERLETLELGFRELEPITSEINTDTVDLAELKFAQFKMHEEYLSIYDSIVEQMNILQTAEKSHALVVRLTASSVEEEFAGQFTKFAVLNVRDSYICEHPYFTELQSLVDNLDDFRRFRAISELYNKELPGEPEMSFTKHILRAYERYSTSASLRRPLSLDEQSRISFWKYFLDEALPVQIRDDIIRLLSSTESKCGNNCSALNLSALKLQFSILSENLVEHERICSEIFENIVLENIIDPDVTHIEELEGQAVHIRDRIAELEQCLGKTQENTQFDISLLPEEALANPSVIRIFKQQMHPGYSWKELLLEELTLESGVIAEALRVHVIPCTTITQIGDFAVFFDQIDAILTDLTNKFVSLPAGQEEAAKRRELREYSKLKWQENYTSILNKRKEQFSSPVTLKELEEAFSKRNETEMSRSYANPKRITTKRAIGQAKIKAAKIDEDDDDFYE